MLAKDHRVDIELGVAGQNLRQVLLGLGVIQAQLRVLGELIGNDVEVAGGIVDALDADGIALGQTGAQRLVHHELAVGITDQDLHFVLGAADRFDLVAGEQVAVARVEQAGRGAAAAAEQQLAVAGAQVVTQVVGAERGRVQT